MQSGAPPERRPADRRRSRRVNSGTNFRYVLSRRTFLSLHDVELHHVALSERFEAAALDGAVVHEAVLLPIVGRDEAEPLRVIEPLHLAGRTHSELLV